MDDLISRQAAIDAADAVWSVTGDKNVAKVWDQIKDLPSAQPELAQDLPNACTDAISRQAAIDALIELYEYQRDIDPTEAADLVRQGIYLAEKKIEQMPSAQPEEDCDTCKHGYFGDTCCNNCKVRFPSHYERRTDER